MPASAADPISSALRHNGSSTSAAHTLENGLVSSAKKTLLSASVAFDPPIRHLGGALKKSGILLLNPARNKCNQPKEKPEGVDGTENGTEGNDKAPAPPTPKVVFFPAHAVEVGYRSARSAGAGMFNMGNTCYLNSTLQALFHTPALFNYLASGEHQRQCNKNGSSAGLFHSCIICALAATLKDTLQSNITRPSRVYDKLKLICKHFVHGRQEDAHEFLRYLIESLQRSFLHSCQAPKNLDNASKETTPFNQIFGGYLRQDVTCLNCKHVSITFQHFMDLLLDIRQASTLEQALAVHFRAERIGNDDNGSNMYKCERCKTKVPAKKKSFICRPPVVLCIQLKRFSLGGCKISKPVQLSRRINVTQFVKRENSTHDRDNEDELTYRLVSMITHVGPSPNCGHYTAIGEAGNGKFFQFDDSSVRPISVAQALNTASYVVIYEMTQETKSAWVKTPCQRAKNMPCTATSTTIANSPPPASSSTSSISAPPPVSAASPSASSLQQGTRIEWSKTPKCPETVKARLVPYHSDSSSDSDEETEHNGKAKPIAKQEANGVPVKKSLPFIPRALTMNSLKRNTEAQPNNADSADRPSSVASSASNGITKTSRSGVWRVTDADQHTPSVASDNSNGSTSNNWKISEVGQSKSTEQQQRMVVEREPFRPQSQSGSLSTASSSLASTPERRIKRNSSMEEYEAELDRGRSKKVKQRHSGDQQKPTFNANSYNPFQTRQNRGYQDSHYRHHRDHHRGHYHHHHHRDHSYHEFGSDQRSSGFYGRRSYSSSSLHENRDYGNRQRSNKDRFYNHGNRDYRDYRRYR